jgi:hypothetical protein
MLTRVLLHPLSTAATTATIKTSAAYLASGRNILDLLLDKRFVLGWGHWAHNIIYLNMHFVMGIKRYGFFVCHVMP